MKSLILLTVGTVAIFHSVPVIPALLVMVVIYLGALANA